MIRLLKIELKKIAHNKSFWIIMGLYALTLIFIFWSIQVFINDFVTETGKKVPIPVTKISLYQFPYIWHNFSYLATGLKLLLAFITIILVTNEYSYRTIRQNIITGLSHWEVLGSKLLVIFLISVASALFIFINGLILGLIHTDNITLNLMTQKTSFLLAYILELFSFMTIAIFFGFLIKKAGFALTGFLIYYIIIESILHFKVIPNNWGEYLPFRSISNIIAIPNTSLMKLFGVNFREDISIPHTLTTIGYVILFSYLTYLLLRKRDL